MTMTLVQTVTLASASTTITFTNIPQSGKDLRLLISHDGSAAGSFWVRLQTNGIDMSDYRNLNGSGSVVISQNSPNVGVTWVDSQYPTTNTFHSTEIYIHNYTSTVAKGVTVDTAVEANSNQRFGNMLAITSAITTSAAPVTSITLTATSNMFTANSTASLYTISTIGATGATVV